MQIYCLNQLIKEPTRVTEHTVEHTALKKAGTCKRKAEAREVKSFKRYNREDF